MGRYRKLKKVAIFHMLPSGGGIRVLRQFAVRLSRRFEVSIHVPRGGSLLGSPNGITEIEYPYPIWTKPRGVLRWVAPAFLMLRLRRFESVCRTAAEAMSSSADVALVHNSMPVAAPPVLEHLKIPSLYFCYEYPRHIYDSDIIKRTSNPLYEAALRPLARLEKRMDSRSAKAASSTATFSEYMRDRIESLYGISSGIVRPGVDSDFFSPSEMNGSDRNSVLSVGALWPFKGHETAIRAVSLIEAELRPELVIVADREYPRYRWKLTDLATSLSVKLTIRQSIDDMELRELYRNARAVLCCQHREPYGLVPLESMACETPVIARAEGGFMDNVIDYKNGLLFDGTPESAAELLSGILADPALAERIGKSGRQFVAGKRTLDQGAHKLGDMLESM